MKRESIIEIEGNSERVLGGLVLDVERKERFYGNHRFLGIGNGSNKLYR